MPLRLCVTHHPVDGLVRQVAKQKNILSGNTDIVREADDWHTRWSCEGCRFDNMVAAQWPQNDLVTVRNRPFGCCCHTKASVVRNHPDVGDFSIRQCQGSCIGNRLPDIGVWSRDGQQQGDPMHAIHRVSRYNRRRPFAARDCGTCRQQDDGCQYQQLFDLAC